MTSPFIEGSKHADFTAAVEDHFFGSKDPKRLLKAAPGGDPRGNVADTSGFPTETGVNYTPRDQAGHTTK